ncbi:hypothetical protein PHISP_00023 [Aspergillus sp. HF37]|nr:hypothetical protein PHISP_00023 [Aspergillus sp. HF37]
MTPDPYANVNRPPGGQDGPEGPGRNTDGPNTNPQTIPRGAGSNVISGRGGEEEFLHPDYERQRNPRRFFKLGKVFSILWHENAGLNGTAISAPSQFTRGRFGEEIYGTIRRMVVVREQHNCAWCLPICTYSRQGVAKPGINAQDHAVIYMTGSEPWTSPAEPRMTKEPLEIMPDRPDKKLDKMSRLNFGKVYTVEHNVKVMPVGKVTERSKPKLEGYISRAFRFSRD